MCSPGIRVLSRKISFRIVKPQLRVDRDGCSCGTGFGGDVVLPGRLAAGRCMVRFVAADMVSSCEKLEPTRGAGRKVSTGIFNYWTEIPTSRPPIQADLS